jgi:hypothetical protein
MCLGWKDRLFLFDDLIVKQVLFCLQEENIAKLVSLFSVFYFDDLSSPLIYQYEFLLTPCL